MVSAYPGLASGTVGAIGELRVAVDLLRRGLPVFRSLSPACLCDLVIVTVTRIYRIEVRTAYKRRYASGVYYPRTDEGKFDIFAGVLPDSIFYDPSGATSAEELASLGLGDPAS